MIGVLASTENWKLTLFTAFNPFNASLPPWVTADSKKGRHATRAIESDDDHSDNNLRQQD